jgi:hypothetical protein
MKRTVKILIWIVLIAGAASLLELFVFRRDIKQPAPQAQNNISNQQPVSATNSTAQIAANNANSTTAANSDPAPTPDTTPDPSSDPLPAKFLLPIPFYSQAPLGNWDTVHEEMCEEASLLNAGLFLQDKKLSGADYDRELLKMKDLGEKTVGTWVSTTVADTKKLADIYFAGKIKSKIINNPTIEDIETEIAAGNPVIVPLAGREIGNPNFTPPGPVYHMLVVKGYDSQNFVTNDVGTRKGDSYVYKKEIIMEKMYDWNPQDIHLGAKRVLVLYK